MTRGVAMVAALAVVVVLTPLGAPTPAANSEEPTITTTVAPTAEESAPAEQPPVAEVEPPAADVAPPPDSDYVPPAAPPSPRAQAPAEAPPPEVIEPEQTTQPSLPTPETAGPGDTRSTAGNAPRNDPGTATNPSGDKPETSSTGEVEASSGPVATAIEQQSAGPTPMTTSTVVARPTPAAQPHDEPILVPEPRFTEANSEAVAAAKVAPAVTIDPVTPPAPPPNVTVNFTTALDAAAVNEVNIRNQVFVPPVWRYIDYDRYYRPIIYNPVGLDVTYRYWYDGAYRTVWVPAGGRIVLNAPIVGVFPFTAVGAGGFVTVGNFCGGGWVPPPGWVGPPPAYWQPPPPPVVWQNMRVQVPAVGRSVTVRKVTVVSRDQRKPLGQQDTFMLDDSRLAVGQISEGRDGGEIVVNKSQATPGAGPMDDGGPIVRTTELTSSQREFDWMPWLLAALVVAIATAGGVITWVLRHPGGGLAGENTFAQG